MEGALSDVNAALKKMIINLDDNITACNGVVEINDFLNPIFNQTISDLSGYFYNNTPPVWIMDSPPQSYVDKTLLYTDTYFQIVFSSSMFDQDDVTFYLVEDESVEWINQVDLSIGGIPPEPSCLSFGQRTMMCISESGTIISIGTWSSL